MSDEPRLAFVHVDDVPWTEVIAQLHGERRVSVHEKFLEWNAKRMVVLGRYDPQVVIERHGHASDHLVYVLEGMVEEPEGGGVEPHSRVTASPWVVTPVNSTCCGTSSGTGRDSVLDAEPGRRPPSAEIRGVWRLAFCSVITMCEY